MGSRWPRALTSQPAGLAIDVRIENPLCRVPVSLLLDDSCPVVNLSHFYIKLYNKRLGPRERRPIGDMPAEIPVSFARKFGEWCAENGVKGKFSFIPMPAGLGTIDRELPGFPKARLDEWIRATKEIIRPNFDLTPEMITHCQVVDLSDWTMTSWWENETGAWGPLPGDWLTRYIAAALRILRNIDIAAKGVTSPGDFGRADLDGYAAATLRASKAVNDIATPYFYCEGDEEGIPWPKLYSLDKKKGEACVSILSCTDDWFGGWEGDNRAAVYSPDMCITEDLLTGRLPQVIAAGCPAVIVAHWQGFYFEGEELGFRTFKVVVERINRLPNILWMKPSEIARYWMAREMVQIEANEGGCRITSPISCDRFTLRLSPARSGGWRVNSKSLREVSDPLSLQPGAWTQDADDTLLAFHLPPGETVVESGVSV